MGRRQLPVRPDRAQLEAEAERLAGELGVARSEARDSLAREYGVESFARLSVACEVVAAIWNDDTDALRALITRDHQLLHEDARGVPGNWGPPMSYAANLGRTGLVEMLLAMGAVDVQHAFDRACLQGRIDTARRLSAAGARPEPGILMGPAETHNADGLAFLLGLGAPIGDEHGNATAPVAMLLESYGRDPSGKHRCLELLAGAGVDLPDTPAMAVHRGRIDLLERHLARDRQLFRRTLAHGEIYPPGLGCHADHSLALHGAPLCGGTLMHLCVDNDELELAQWMIAQGAPVDAPAAIDGGGFGGHTALYGCVVSQPYRVGRRRDDVFARLLLDQGANPVHRASLRKRLRFVADESEHEYRNVTPCEFGQRFHDRDWVSPPVMDLLRARHGAG